MKIFSKNTLAAALTVITMCSMSASVFAQQGPAADNAVKKTVVKQTAGRDRLGDFAPQFAQLNDDVLFGEVWSRDEQLSLKLRSIVTISTLIGKGITDSSLKYHLESARKNGVTKEEMAEILTHIAFYAGWPNAWAAFPMAKEVYADVK